MVMVLQGFGTKKAKMIKKMINTIITFRFEETMLVFFKSRSYINKEFMEGKTV